MGFSGRRLTLLAAVLLLPSAHGFSQAVAPRTEAGARSAVLETKDVVNKVAVAGATGRTGRLVVEELLDREVSNVVAIVRDADKANQVFANPPPNLEIVECDLTSEQQIESVLNGTDAAIWCATGFSDAPGVSVLEKMKRMMGLALTPKRSIDTVGIPAFAKCLSSLPSKGLPKVVMLSSAGVTRPTWDKEKKERFWGAAEIPIVRLNPFNILDMKRESEQALRESGVDYCIVRPGGLNDNWPAGSRPVLSQGDVAVGRIHRKDVASVLVDVLSQPEATGKTFEVVALAGYPKATSIGPALSRLSNDKDGLPPIDYITATYSAMQQLLPGEQQDAAALAMGQTYEQLDKNEVGRLGKRGEEKFESVAPKPSS